METLKDSDSHLEKLKQKVMRKGIGWPMDLLKVRQIQKD